MHIPVLIDEVIKYLDPRDNETYVDATFGAGGYSRAILSHAKCKVYAIDRDKNAKKIADKLKEEFKERFDFLSGNFSDIKKLLKSVEVSKVNGIVFDLGVSSMQLDQKDRGFSFDSDAKLDMRMNQDSDLSAFEVVNNFSQEELASIIKEFGEEPKAKLIAKKIIDRRKTHKITSCREFADIVRSLYHGYSKTDPATRTFQAIRIYVNKELDEISLALKECKELLKIDARLLVVSFHSLEDGLVKEFLKKESGSNVSFSRYEPVFEDKNFTPTFKILTKSAIKPSENEIKFNNRSRSSRMRVAIKIN